MKKIVSLTIIGLLFLVGCGAPQLKDGEELVAELDNLQITADDVYQEMKQMYGAQALVEIIDNHIADQEVETTDEILNQVDEMVEMYKMQYEQQGQDWEELLVSSGFRNQAEFEETLLNNLKREKALEEFLKRNLSEADVKDYYENDYHGQMDVRHILIRPDEGEGMQDPALDDGMQDEEALDEAYDKATEIIEKLNDGADFVEMVEKYSDDNVGEDSGLIPNVSLEDHVDDFYYAAKALDVDEYTKEPVQTQFGYHIILKVHEEEKPSFEEAEAEIKAILAERTLEQSDDEKFRELWGELRQEYGIEIYDDDIRAVYNQNFVFFEE